MKIASASLQMSASHVLTQHSETQESLQMWVGSRPGASAAGTGPSNTERVTLSDSGKALANESSVQGTDETDDASDLDPKLSLIRSMLEHLFGRAIKVFNAGDLHRAAAQIDAPPQDAPAQPSSRNSAGFGLTYDYHARVEEVENTQFSATGIVKTADGREINFSVNLTLSRSYTESTDISLRLGDAARKVDPLVLNFNGTAAQLSDQTFAFDLNSDGKKENLATLASNSGFLAFDRNGNGKIDNGGELFGPGTGNGFSELSALDDDHNGWIDENDAAFGRLQVWRPAAQGDGQLQSLRAANVGAISLSAISTPFDIRNSDNQSLGQVRSTATLLQEDGFAGTIQQIDLSA